MKPRLQLKSLSAMQADLLTRREQRGKEVPEEDEDEESDEEEKAKGKGKDKGKKKSKPKAKAASKKPATRGSTKKPACAKPAAKRKAKVDEEEKETKPKGGKKPLEEGGDDAAEEKQKPKRTKTQKDDPETAEPAKKGEGKAGRKAATWASRWLPTCPIARKKFDAIRKVYEECCAHKLRSQSTLQSPFFMQCSKAFVAQEISDDAPAEDFVACAELQDDAFVATDAARNSALNFVVKKLVKLKLVFPPPTSDFHEPVL